MKKVLGLLAAIALLAGCYNDKADKLYPVGTTINCDTSGTMSFSADILPTMQSQCATSGCHDASSAQSGYDLTGYTGIKAMVDNDRMLGVIRQDAGFSAMPKGGTKLDDCYINKVTRWIHQGAYQN
ncbi:MAG: hypothetical protein JST82_01750 [Bacteroidetes bacterium]|nr:hypothetical protein [Bacteroidota bacterium]